MRKNNVDNFAEELKKIFIDEATLNLSDVEGCFLELEGSAEPKNILIRIFRLAHNLKGGSMSVGFADVAALTHELENLVLALQKGQVDLTTGVISTLLTCNDRLIEMMLSLKQDINATCDNSELIAQVKAHLSGDAPAAQSASVKVTKSAPVAEKNEKHPGLVFFDDEPEEKPTKKVNASSDAGHAPGSPEKSKTAKGPTSPAKAEDEVVRVSLSRIELLNDYVGELIVMQSMLQTIVNSTSNSSAEKLAKSINDVTKICKVIQTLSMGLRMLPVKPLVQKLTRTLRDTATALGKDVRLEVQGDQMDIDKSVLDQLGDPLVHIIRNSADHGLETKEERAKTSKNPQGVVQLTFLNQGNSLIVEVRDDGPGIDPAFIRKKALEKNLISASDIRTDKEIMMLIFAAGFSTKSVTTDVSGRGVGMDVVKTNVEKIGGEVDVFSEAGKGSLIRLKIPLSLAVVDALVMTTNRGRFVIPLSQVQETVNLNSLKITSKMIGIGECIELRGDVLPLYRLEKLLEPNREASVETDSTALIFKVQEQMVAVSIKELINSQQVVIKPLGNGVAAQVGWVGSCVLGDGLPTLIVNPVDMLTGKITNANHKLVRSS
jgi:two-component system, chemotaxis family, sensor kinase CheA